MMFEICDEVSIHKDFDFPGHKHASLYDVTAIEPAVNKALVEEGIEVKLIHRATKINIYRRLDQLDPYGERLGHRGRHLH